MAGDKVKKFKKAGPAYTVDNTSTDVTDVPTITRLLNRKRFGQKNASASLKSNLSEFTRNDLDVPAPREKKRKRRASESSGNDNESPNPGLFFGPSGKTQTQTPSHLSPQDKTKSLVGGGLEPTASKSTASAPQDEESYAGYVTGMIPVKNAKKRLKTRTFTHSQATPQTPVKTAMKPMPIPTLDQAESQTKTQAPEEGISSPELDLPTIPSFNDDLDQIIEKEATRTGAPPIMSEMEKPSRPSPVQTASLAMPGPPPRHTHTFATGTETAPTPVQSEKPKDAQKIIVWTKHLLSRSNDPLGQALLHLARKGAHSALFMAIHPPLAGSRAPRFKSTAFMEGTRKAKAWNQLTWDPSMTPSLWNEFIKTGKLDLHPNSDGSSKAAKIALIRESFQVTSHEWLVLVRAGPIHACRGALAIAADQSILRAVNDVFHLICSPLPGKNSAA